MNSDTNMPTRESLDEAARAFGWATWEGVSTTRWVYHTRSGLIQFARTLDALHKREPVDPDVEAVKRIIATLPERGIILWGEEALARAVAQFKQEKAR